jgi:galactonate dehydratase
MRIIGLQTRVVHVNQRGDWVHILIETDEGIIGIGEASHGGFGPNRDALVEHILRTQCAPALMGKDPRHVIARFAELQPVAVGLPGATAVSACEQALWDIAGQVAGVPVARLFGGDPTRPIPLYANINRAVTDRTPAGFTQAAAAAVGEGFAAIKLAPFDGIVPREIRSAAMRQRVEIGLECVAGVRDAVRPDVMVMVDCHSAFDLGTAHWVAQELTGLGVTWIEEPIPMADLDGLVALRGAAHALGAELVGGELAYGVAGVWPYLSRGALDVIMPDVKHCGGLHTLRVIADVASEQGVFVAPHNPSGPLATIASGQALAGVHEHRPLEIAWGEVPWRHELLSSAEDVSDGQLRLSDRAGLGVELNQRILMDHGI